MRQLAIRLPSLVIEDLTKQAAERGLSISAYVRAVLTKTPPIVIHPNATKEII